MPLAFFVIRITTIGLYTCSRIGIIVWAENPGSPFPDELNNLLNLIHDCHMRFLLVIKDDAIKDLSLNSTQTEPQGYLRLNASKKTH